MQRSGSIESMTSPTVTTRRHPIAWAAYAAAVVTGASYLAGVPIHVLDGTNGWERLFWSSQILVGGLLALITLVVQPRLHPHWPDLADLIRIEGFGSLLCGIGYICYILSVILNGHTTQTPWVQIVGAGSLTTGVLATGRIWRGIQALREARKLDRYVAAAMLAKSAVDAALKNHHDLNGDRP